jgi:hypothetical protein
MIVIPSRVSGMWLGGKPSVMSNPNSEDNMFPFSYSTSFFIRVPTLVGARMYASKRYI